MVEEILENLIGQFSDPLTFYRELIQNALDAGARQIQVALERREDEILIEVRDWGEGMNRRIISEELTRLFASAKEEDFTKIGKFGIGFVSVFAIQPEMVVVDTGRDGESWRVVFDGTATYQCLRLEEPFEGTRIRVHKKLPAAEYDDFVTRSLTSIHYWCRYSDTPIHFNGQAINTPLSIESPVVVRHQQSGTEVVLGLQGQTPTPYGLYNRGLTLVEGVDAFWPGVSFRLKSRYLEHTLTRDNVMRDANYQKALQILRTVASTQLPQALVDTISAQVSRQDLGAVQEIFQAAVPYLSAWRRTLPSRFRDTPMFPTLHSGLLSLNQLRQAASREGAIYIEPMASHVTLELHKVKVPVLWGAHQGGVADAASAVTGRLPQPTSLMVAAPQSPMDAVEVLAPVVPLLSRFLLDAHITIRYLALADFDYAGSSIGHLPCLLQPEPDQPIRLHRKSSWWRWLGDSRLLLNRAHPLVKEVLARCNDAPVLCALILARAFILQQRAWCATQERPSLFSMSALGSAAEMTGHAVIPEWLEERWMSRALATRPRLQESWFFAFKERWGLTPHEEAV